MKTAKPFVFNLAALAVVVLSSRRWLSTDVLLDFAVGWVAGLAVLAIAATFLHKKRRSAAPGQDRSTKALR